MGDARVEFRTGDRLLGVPKQARGGRTFRLALGEMRPEQLTDLQVTAAGRRLDATADDTHRSGPRVARMPAQGPANGVDPGKPGSYRTVTGECDLDPVRLPGFGTPVEMTAEVVAPKGALPLCHQCERAPAANPFRRRGLVSRAFADACRRAHPMLRSTLITSPWTVSPFASGEGAGAGAYANPNGSAGLAVEGHTPGHPPRPGHRLNHRHTLIPFTRQLSPRMPMHRHRVHSDWNYTLHPHPRDTTSAAKNPRSADCLSPRPGTGCLRHPELTGMPESASVADHETSAGLVGLCRQLGYVLIDFRFQCGGQHLAGAFAHNLVDQGAGLGGAVVGDYAEHGRAFPTRAANAGLLGDHHRIIREGTPSAFLLDRSTGLEHCSAISLPRACSPPIAQGRSAVWLRATPGPHPDPGGRC